MRNRIASLVCAARQAVVRFYRKYKEAVFIARNQYRLRFVDYYQIKKNKQFIAVIQVIIRRIKIKLSLQYLASNKYLLRDIHPVDVARIAFIANLKSENARIDIPENIFCKSGACPVVKQTATVKICRQYFDAEKNQTLFAVQPALQNAAPVLEISALELLKKPEMLYGIGSEGAAAIGRAASEDWLHLHKEDAAFAAEKTTNNSHKPLLYYHIICVCYSSLLISGISIVRRLFPFHLPFTHWTIPFGAGIIFFPLTFAIQDLTTEIYGYRKSRQMLWLGLSMVCFYVFYTQLAIHLPSGTAAIYEVNKDYNVVFGLMPRQFVALLVGLFIGTLINDFFISRSKVIFAGQHLWARLLGSTMVGEIVLQVVGGIIGFSDTLDFKTQLLPNMLGAYSYKLLWNIALIPLMYMLTSLLKKKEGIDVYDYDINYNPFVFGLYNKSKSVTKE